MKHRRVVVFLSVVIIIVVAAYIGVSLYLINDLSSKNDILKQEKQGLDLKVKQLEDVIASMPTTTKKPVTPSKDLDNIDLHEKELEYAMRNFVNYQQYIPNFCPLADFILTKPYLPKKNHYGIDLAGKVGEPVYAAASGVVESVEFDDDIYGKILVLDHLNGFKTRYGHNSHINVKVGSFVRKGEQIAEVGNTGISSAPHLHFEILYHNKNIDPESKIK
ncbi:MAG: M23 family metallopeptidase [Candidatus Cloacimonetes bacterium]|nr:M23 family metallopeptidase [Candidatus Cloacimonadota bacterium]